MKVKGKFVDSKFVNYSNEKILFKCHLVKKYSYENKWPVKKKLLTMTKIFL